MPGQKFLTVREVCAHFNVSRSTLDLWTRSGKLQAHRFGRSVRYAASDVARFEAEARGNDRLEALAAEVARLPESDFAEIVATRLDL